MRSIASSSSKSKPRPSDSRGWPSHIDPELDLVRYAPSEPVAVARSDDAEFDEFSPEEWAQLAEDAEARDRIESGFRF